MILLNIWKKKGKGVKKSFTALQEDRQDTRNHKRVEK